MLDPKGRKEVLEVVKKLNEEEGVTVITVTHYMEEVVFADRVVVIDNGKIAMTGTPSEIFNRREELNALGLELPFASLVANRLKEKGLNLEDGILTDEQLARELCKLSQKI
jgi:energy-coupling factor transport system ATP-binding protein